MPEAEPRLDPRCVEVAIADVHALGVDQLLLLVRLGAESGVVRLAGGDRDRETAARLPLAEQDVGEGVAELLAGQPRVQDGGHASGPRQIHRAAGVDDDDRPGIGGGDTLDEFVLATR